MVIKGGLISESFNQKNVPNHYPQSEKRLRLSQTLIKLNTNIMALTYNLKKKGIHEFTNSPIHEIKVLQNVF